MRELEDALFAEQRAVGSAQAKVLTKMRWVPLDPRALHDPDGHVHGSAWAGFRRPIDATANALTSFP